MDRVQVDILGLSTNPASGGAYALVLKEVSGLRRLPIIIGAAEGESILLEREGIKPPHPLAHDLIRNIITSLGAELREITIDEHRDGNFYAKLTIGNQSIDSRPSDAIALAVRCGVPIYVASSVMDEAAFIPDEKADHLDENDAGQVAVPRQKLVHNQSERVRVDILGLSTNPASGKGYALILKELSGPRRLPIIIESADAQSIALEMEGIKPPRPLTHDLMRNIITSLGAELREITIDEHRDATFNAKLTIGNQSIDSRPSDAIALAVRCGVHIYVASSVMDEVAFIPDEKADHADEHGAG